MVLGWWILRMLVGKGVVPWFWNCTFSPPVVDRDRWAVLSSVLELKLSWFSDFAMFSHVSVVSKPGKKTHENTVLHSITNSWNIDGTNEKIGSKRYSTLQFHSGNSIHPVDGRNLSPVEVGSLSLYSQGVLYITRVQDVFRQPTSSFSMFYFGDGEWDRWR